MTHLCPFFATPDDNNASFVAGAWRVISKERERLRNLHKRMPQIPTPASQALDDNKPFVYITFLPEAKTAAI